MTLDVNKEELTILGIPFDNCDALRAFLRPGLESMGFS